MDLPIKKKRRLNKEPPTSLFVQPATAQALELDQSSSPRITSDPVVPAFPRGTSDTTGSEHDQLHQNVVTVDAFLRQQKHGQSTASGRTYGKARRYAKPQVADSKDDTTDQLTSEGRTSPPCEDEERENSVGAPDSKAGTSKRASKKRKRGPSTHRDPGHSELDRRLAAHLPDNALTPPTTPDGTLLPRPLIFTPISRLSPLRRKPTLLPPSSTLKVSKSFPKSIFAPPASDSTFVTSRKTPRRPVTTWMGSLELKDRANQSTLNLQPNPQISPLSFMPFKPQNGIPRRATAPSTSPFKAKRARNTCSEIKGSTQKLDMEPLACGHQADDASKGRRGTDRAVILPAPPELATSVDDFDEILSENTRPGLIVVEGSSDTSACHSEQYATEDRVAKNARKPLKSLSSFFPEFFEAARSVTKIERRPSKPAPNTKLEDFFSTVSTARSATPSITEGNSHCHPDNLDGPPRTGCILVPNSAESSRAASPT
ncbi:hypothetical protein SISNIDRAFT_550561 [Sistotremastrum niveocremeum HHB9708]|uniref:Uncharacterized protein n=2 Tax=Sistotremastraceae TaxID=3402574 RepID=A0A164TRP6_9AGAM|nr:hypothetical protein SISNIDRAFT_550561 [Sistotremastrum niveocremeum HHB9708]KZT42249.1 hypothetical protein SISSUDRAFT_1125907 [Sistotremastrum suecicum HHB10207 ss-3]